jgi:ABC-type multidrug transport system ATPase subunit
MHGSLKAIAYRNFLLNWKSDMLSMAFSVLTAFKFFISQPHSDIVLLVNLAVVQFNQERKMVEVMVGDRSSKFKAIFTSMGLRREQYLFSHCLYFIAQGLTILACYGLVMVSFNRAFGIELVSEFECQSFALLSLNVVLSTFYATSLSFMFQNVEVSKVVYQYLTVIVLFVSMYAIQYDMLWLLKLFLPHTGLIVFITGWVRNNYQSVDIKESLYYLVWQISFYFVSAVYLENVRGRNDGFNRHPLYFLKWLIKAKKSQTSSEEILISGGGVEKPSQTVSGGIKVRDLSKKFDTLTALDRISLDLERGKIHCLLGQNGAGKSTLMNILAGVSKSTQGSVMFEGEDLKSLYNRQSRKLRVGICPPQDILFIEITVRQHLRLVCYIKEVEEIDLCVDESLRLVGLAKFSKFSVSQLSGGLRRRLSLAMSLIGNPNLLLLDEPTSSIDIVLRRDFLKLLNGIKNSNKNLVIVLSTHLLEEAEVLADKIIIINQGLVEFQGTKQEIKDKYGIALTIRIYPQKEVRSFVLEEFLGKICELLGDLSNYVDKIKIKQNGLKLEINQSKVKAVKALICATKQHLPYGMIVSLNSNTMQQAYAKKLKSNYNSSEQNREAVIISILGRMYTENSSSWLEMTRLIVEFKIRYIFSNLRDFIKICFTVYNSLIFGYPLKIIMSFDDAQFYSMIYLFYGSLIGFQIIYSSFAASTLIDNRFAGLTNLFYINRVPVAVYYIGNLLVDFLFTTFEYFLMFVSCSFVLIVNAPISNEYLKNISGSFLLLYAWKLTFSCSSTLYYRLLPKSKGSYFGIVYLFYCGVFKFLSEFVSDKFEYFNEIALLSKSLKNPASIDLTYFLVVFALGSIYLIIAILIDEIHLRIIFKNKGEETKYDVNYRRNTDENSWLNIIKENSKTTVRSDFDRNLSTTPIFLEVRALSKIYPKSITVLKDVTFSIEKGVSFGLVGPNGAGKSTLLNIIFGNIDKTSGWVRIDEKTDSKGIFSSIFGPNIFSSLRLAACFQENAFWKDLSVKDNIFFFARLHKIQPGPLLELIRYFHLDQFLGTKAEFLSCGNKRKLCILMSLLINPNLVIFDEATCGVDLSTKLTLRSVLKYLKTKNKASLLLSTHFLEDTQIYCDKIGIIDKGELLCIGDRVEFQERRCGYSVSLTFSSEISKMNLLSELSELATFKIVRENLKGLKTEYILTDIKNPTELFLLLLSAEEDGNVEEFSINELSIEDIYVDLFRDSTEPWV